MASIKLVLLLTFSLIVDNTVCSVEVNTKEWVESLSRAGLMVQQEMKNKKERQFSQRQLQEFVFHKDPPKRQCGEVINTVTKDEILSMFEGFNKAVFLEANDPVLEAFALSIFSGPVEYGVQARVVCGSCADVLQTLEASNSSAASTFATTTGSTSSHGFLTYCGPDRFAHNVTFSGLALIPINETTTEPLTGHLQSFITNVGLNAPQQGVPSQRFPVDFGFFQNANSTYLLTLLEELVEIFPALLGTSSGVIGIIPDYSGYGHSYLMPRALTVKQSYQRIGTAIWFATKKVVDEISHGCVVMDKNLTLSGTSEGGFSAFAQGLAFTDMGFDVLSAQVSLAPLRLEHQLIWSIERIKNQSASEFLTFLLPFLGVAYSSTNPDLLNSNRGQDFLSSAWMDPVNDTQNVIKWLENDFTRSGIIKLFPSRALDMVNPAILQLVKNATGNVSTVCDVAVPGETDLLCQAILANDLIMEVESTPFPMSLCFSPQDDVISYGNLPNFSKSDLLTEFVLFGRTATGDHVGATLFCLFNQIAPFTTLRVSSMRVPNSIDPLTDEPDYCGTGARSTHPTSSPTTVSQSNIPTRLPASVVSPAPTPQQSSTSDAKISTLMISGALLVVSVVGLYCID